MLKGSIFPQFTLDIIDKSENYLRDSGSGRVTKEGKIKLLYQQQCVSISVRTKVNLGFLVGTFCKDVDELLVFDRQGLCLMEFLYI